MRQDLCERSGRSPTQQTTTPHLYFHSLTLSLSPLSPWKEGGPFISIEAILRCSKRSRNFSRVTQRAECQKRDEFHSVLSFEAGGRTSAGNRCGNPSVRRTAREKLPPFGSRFANLLTGDARACNGSAGTTAIISLLEVGGTREGATRIESRDRYSSNPAASRVVGKDQK